MPDANAAASVDAPSGPLAIGSTDGQPAMPDCQSLKLVMSKQYSKIAQIKVIVCSAVG